MIKAENWNLPADGLHVVRTYTDSKSRNATTKWVGSEAVTAEITKDDDGEYLIKLNHKNRETTFTIDDLNQKRIEYVKNIEGDDITTYLWTFDNTWDHILKGTGDYKYMVRLGTSTYNEETFVNERTFFYLVLQPLMCQPKIRLTMPEIWEEKCRIPAQR